MAKPETTDAKLRRAGFRIVERPTGKEPVWQKQQRLGEYKLFTQSEAVAIVERVAAVREKVAK